MSLNHGVSEFNFEGLEPSGPLCQRFCLAITLCNCVIVVVFVLYKAQHMRASFKNFMLGYHGCPPCMWCFILLITMECVH